MQIQKTDNEKKIKYDLRQLESWAQVYKMKNSDFKGFDEDMEIKMIKIDLVAATGNPVEINFDDNYEIYCIKAIKDKKTYCIDDTGDLVEDGTGCKPGTGTCKQ
ncbi:MAG: hypothetical protein WCX30_00620 [Candidatus Paceibacterota bacterium]|nr:hypothetical protein [bacterium]